MPLARSRTLLLAVLIAFLEGDRSSAQPLAPARTPAALDWRRVTERAAFPPSYNFPVHVAADGRFVALHSEGTWTSVDGAKWTRSSLPPSGTNTAYLGCLSHAGSTWALGSHTGDYLGFTLDRRIRRTSDHRSWVTVGQSATLPSLVFYAAASFRGAMWIMGGYDGTREQASVWRSSDGLEWRRVVEKAPWSARAGARAIVFRDRLWLLGGGVVDGVNHNDVWSSADGIEWKRETAQIAAEEPVGYSPVVFRGRLWLVGANRSGRFSSEMLVSDDGRSWHAETAPWSPRGGVAVWTHGDALYLTGGKSSHVEHGEIVFTYSNDVWRMSARGAAAP